MPLRILQTAVAGDNKRWIMVADTNSLLNKVSRKALQLLQGVKGTQLIIPRVGKFNIYLLAKKLFQMLPLFFFFFFC